MNTIKPIDIAKMIDHSLLSPIMTEEDIINGCEIAKKYQTASVCVKPCDVKIAGEILKGSDVLLSTVIGFPHGSNTTKIKCCESEEACANGCTELDMVLNIGRLLGGDFEYVESDIKAVCDVAHKNGAIVKVILENAYLSSELIKVSSKICEKAGADFVKTSSGYAPSGAFLKDLRIMRKAVSTNVKVKAAGGVRTLDAALKVRAVGCSRFGCTATATIIDEATRRYENNELFEVDDNDSIEL